MSQKYHGWRGAGKAPKRIYLGRDVTLQFVVSISGKFFPVQATLRSFCLCPLAIYHLAIYPPRSIEGKKIGEIPPPLPPIVVVTPTELLMNYFFGRELEPFRPKLVRKRAACPFRAWQMFDGVTTWPLARCATSWKTVFAYDRSILPPPSVPAPPFSTSFPLFFPLLSLSRVFFTSSRLVKRRLNSISSYLLTYSLLCVANNGFHRLSNDDCWLASSLPTS